jgi:putative glutamine amidotransferase
VRSPVVGITAAIESAGWTVWEGVESNLSPRAYSLRVEEAGATPLVLPAHEAAVERPDGVLDLVDALILAGGADLDPASYGAEPAPETIGYRAERDRFELALVRRALERELPTLGICRGMELLNVARGGTLDQHLDDLELHLHTPGQFADHDVQLEPGSLAERVVGAGRVPIRSHHHQGIAELGEGLVATGWAEPGGLIEAIELPAHSFALGILWHAEQEPHTRVIGALVEAARAQAVPA